jgi:hypothetical protein
MKIFAASVLQHVSNQSMNGYIEKDCKIQVRETVKIQAESYEHTAFVICKYLQAAVPWIIPK